MSVSLLHPIGPHPSEVVHWYVAEDGERLDHALALLRIDVEKAGHTFHSSRVIVAQKFEIPDDGVRPTGAAV